MFQRCKALQIDGGHPPLFPEMRISSPPRGQPEMCHLASSEPTRFHFGTFTVHQVSHIFTLPSTSIHLSQSGALTATWHTKPLWAQGQEAPREQDIRGREKEDLAMTRSSTRVGLSKPCPAYLPLPLIFSTIRPEEASYYLPRGPLSAFQSVTKSFLSWLSLSRS